MMVTDSSSLSCTMICQAFSCQQGTREPGQLCGSSYNTLCSQHMFQPESTCSPVLTSGWVAASLAACPCLRMQGRPLLSVPCGAYRSGRDFSETVASLPS